MEQCEPDSPASQPGRMPGALKSSLKTQNGNPGSGK